MWSEFLEFFGSGDPDMFDTDEEFSDLATEDQPIVAEEELAEVDDTTQIKPKSYAPV
jgi:hypothetical protein